MSRVRSKYTKPEMRVWSALHRMGYRFRLHRKNLPAKPAIVLPKHRAVIFVHRCFWHQHPGCRRATIPQRNADYWGPKLRRNVECDKEAQRLLRERGWRVVVLWECEMPRGARSIAEAGKQLRNALGAMQPGNLAASGRLERLEYADLELRIRSALAWTEAAYHEARRMK